jgi:hypothetical protein
MACVSHEIRTEHLPNTIQELCRYTEVLGDRDEAPKLKTQDVIVCCVVRAIRHLRGRWYVSMSNGGMMIIKGKSKSRLAQR